MHNMIGLTIFENMVLSTKLALIKDPQSTVLDACAAVAFLLNAGNARILFRIFIPEMVRAGVHSWLLISLKSLKVI